MSEIHDKAIHLHKNVPADWYDSSIKSNLFQWIWHTKRFREIKKLIEKIDGSILDIGCADGTFTKVIFDMASPQKIIGIDVMAGAINFAKNKFKKNKKMLFRIGDAHKLQFKENSFDAAFCLEALEHVLDPLQVLKEMYRVVKRGGYIVILVPSESLMFRIGWAIWQKFPGKGIWEHTHLHNFSNGFLEDLISKVGFSIERNKKFAFGMLHMIKAKKD